MITSATAMNTPITPAWTNAENQELSKHLLMPPVPFYWNKYVGDPLPEQGLAWRSGHISTASQVRFGLRILNILGGPTT